MNCTVKLAIASVALITLSSFASADPIYLTCSITKPDGNPNDFEVALDEDSRKITHTYTDGSAFNTEGFFSAEEVAYKEVTHLDRDTTVTIQYTISRTNLSARQVSTGTGLARDVHEVGAGACTLKKTPARKF